MLSYRHAFHAGNHADVLKHLVLIELLDYLGQKDKPYLVVDTHAGAGRYALHEGYATKLGEWREGIARLWDARDLPAPLARYVATVRGFNPNGNLVHYPGSPLVALAHLREQDRLRVFELHTTDGDLLKRALPENEKRMQIHLGDGYAGLKAAMPPPSRRGLALIDPSYEQKEDYSRVVQALRDALTRFAGGVYALWYPQLSKLESRKLPERLKALPAKSWLHVALTVRAATEDGMGMFGSGMFVLNPPWTLRATLEATMPYLAQALAQGEGAGYTLESGEA